MYLYIVYKFLLYLFSTEKKSYLLSRVITTAAYTFIWTWYTPLINSNSKYDG